MFAVLSRRYNSVWFCLVQLQSYSLFTLVDLYANNCPHQPHFFALLRIILFCIYKTWNIVELVRNVMAHAQKPHFVFRLIERVHSNRRGSQFSRLLAAEVCASAWVMLDRPRPEVAWEYWLPTPFASFPFNSPPVRHHVPPGSERALPETRPHKPLP